MGIDSVKIIIRTRYELIDIGGKILANKNDKKTGSERNIRTINALKSPILCIAFKTFISTKINTIIEIA
ncbi:MAG: hypothetical protein ACTSQS_19020, partial [Promethearchaeota archaeon]